jgi:hypothetical protein
MKKMWIQLVWLMFLGMSVSAATLPVTTNAPSGIQITTKELWESKSSHEGQVVEISFLGISYLLGKEEGVYEGCLCSPESSPPLYPVYFGPKGISFFQQYESLDSETTSKERSVYAFVCENRLIILGDRFSEKNGYRWSKMSKKVNFEKERVWTIRELGLYGQDLLGRVVEVEFNSRTRNKKLDDDYFSTLLFPRGDALGVFTFYPASGISFFDGVGSSEKSYTLFARVSRLIDLDLTLEQQKIFKVEPKEWDLMLEVVGSRRQGKGERATYKW